MNKNNLLFWALLTSTSLVSANVCAADYDSFEEAVKQGAEEYTFEDDETIEEAVKLTSEMTINGNNNTVSGVSITVDAGENTITINDLIFEKMNSEGDLGGGAILNHGSVLVDGKTSIFRKNTSTSFGGAISNYASANDAVFTIDAGDILFESNSAENDGGAIYNFASGEYSALLTINGKSAFVENISGANGGAISNINGEIEFNNTAGFRENSSTTSGGAIYNNNKITFNKDATFNANNSEQAGAIMNDGGEIKINSNANFNRNYAENDGGALYNNGGSITIDGDATFSGNYSKNANGGAIYNLADLTINGDAIFSGNSTFYENKAKGDEEDEEDDIISITGLAGGALWNGGNFEINGTATFADNKAKTDGGAIYNNGTLNLTEDANFTNNSAGNLGGAIYNTADGTINFSGNATFSGNTAGEDETANDIYNQGSIIVAENTSLTLDGGISGDGSITFEEGSSLTVKAGQTTISNNVTTNNADLTLILENGYSGGIVDLVTGSMNGEFNITQNNLYNIEAATTGSYEVSKKTATDFMESLGADINQANAIENIVYAQSDNDSFNEVANAVSALLQTNSTVGDGLDAITAWTPEVSNLVQQQETDTSNQVFSAVSSRLSSGTMSGRRGIASGDNPLTNIAAWGQALYNKAKLSSSSTSRGWDSETYGMALGLEGKVSPSVKIGAGYAYGKTSVDGFYRVTDVYTHTGLLYGEFKPNNWFVNGITSYSWSDYREKKDVAGYTVKAKYNVDTYGFQTMTGYEFKAPQSITIVPEVGLRYLHLKQDSYQDSTNVRVASENGNVFTGVAGTKFSQSWIINCKTVITPEFRVAATYDFSRTKADSYILLPNGSAYEVKGQPIKRFGIEVGAGVTAEISKRTELSASYEGRFRDKYHEHSGLFGVKYKF